MLISEIFIFILVGSFTGTIAGLMGIGGGLIYVPVLIWYFEGINLEDNLVALVSVSTSLAIIILSIISGTITHYKHSNLVFKTALILVIGGIIGALLSTFILIKIESGYFKLFLGAFQLLVAIRILWPGSFSKEDKKQASNIFLLLTGFVAGLISAFFGVGGGLIIVPALTIFGGFSIKKAIGTSSGYMLVITSISLISYQLQSQSINFPKENFFNSIYLPAFIIIAIFAFIFNSIGATLVHKISGEKLNWIFGVGVLLISFFNLTKSMIKLQVF